MNAKDTMEEKMETTENLEEKNTQDLNKLEIEHKDFVDEKRNKSNAEDITAEMKVETVETKGHERTDFDFDHAISVASKHRHLEAYMGDALSGLCLDSDDTMFKENPLDDIRNFNEWLIEHSEKPIPYTWNGNHEGVLVAPLKTKLTKQAAENLVIQARSHESFNVYQTVKLQSSIAVELGYVFGKTNPIMDVNLFGHWLRCEGKPPLVVSLSATDMQSDPDTDTGEVGKNGGNTMDDQSGLADNSDNNSDSDVHDPEQFHYPPAPTCDHPSIKNLISSAAKVGVADV